MFDSDRLCDRCGKKVKGQGIYLPSRRKIFCSPNCIREYLLELERKGDASTRIEGPIYDIGRCC